MTTQELVDQIHQKKILFMHWIGCRYGQDS